MNTKFSPQRGAQFSGSHHITFNARLMPNVVCMISALLLSGWLGNPAHAVEGFTGINAGAPPPTAVTLGHLPLRFEPNQGQFNDAVSFVGQGDGYAMYFASNDLFILGSQGRTRSEPFHPRSRRDRIGDSDLMHQEGQAIRVAFIGAEESPIISGIEKLPGRSNYYHGSNPDNWRQDVPQYAKLRYEELYPGIDVVFYERQNKLEYDFVIHPGADPNRILLQFSGTEEIQLTEKGDLRIPIDGREMILHRPVSYQEINGCNQYYGGKFVLRENNQVGFLLDNYETSLPLIIDPILEYSTFIGASGNEKAWAVDVHSDGTIYMAGETTSANFPLAYAFQTTLYFRDGFIMKLDPTGTSVLFSTYFGGSDSEYFEDICLDRAGNVYLAGKTSSPDCPATSGAFQLNLLGTADGLVVKVNSNGSLSWATLLGGTELEGSNLSDYLEGIALTPEGQVVVAGCSAVADYPLVNPLQADNVGDYDAVVSILDASGSNLLLSSYLGGSARDWFYDVDVDSFGNIYLAGGSDSIDFPVVNAIQGGSAGAWDNIVTKLAPGGASFVYSTYLGGSRSEEAYRIGADVDGCAIISGWTYSIDYPTMNPIQSSRGGDPEAPFVYNTVISKLSPDGSSLEYSTYFGGSRGDEPWKGFDIDEAGNLYISGYTYSYDFPVTDNAFQPTISGGSDCFVLKIDPTGSTFFSSFLGGSGYEQAHGVAIGPDGKVVLVGETNSVDFPTTADALQTEFVGGYDDAFLSRLALGDVRLYDTPRQLPYRLTRLLKNVNTTTPSSDPFEGVQLGDYVYFTTYREPQGLWRTNGVDQVELIKELNIYFYDNHTINVRDEHLYFFAQDPVTHTSGLWISDGTTENTSKLEDIHVSDIQVTDEFVYFSGDHELWRTDGTVAGTVQLYSEGINTYLATPNGVLIPRGDHTAGDGYLVLVDNTTLDETVLLDSVYCSGLNYLNGITYFVGKSAISGDNYWRTDGTPENTYPIHSINESSSWMIYVVGDFLYFRDSDGENRRYYKSSGLPGDAELVENINPPQPGESPNPIASVEPYFTIMGDYLYFVALDGNNQRAIWKSDPNSGVAQKITQPLVANPRVLGISGDLLLFESQDPVLGRELHATDGTVNGEYLVKDIFPGPGFSSPNLVAVNGQELLLSARSPEYGYELWRSNGTEAGTVLVADINQVELGSSPSLFTQSGGLVYFSADDGIHGSELWRTDGTTNGTRMVKDLFPYHYSSTTSTGSGHWSIPYSGRIDLNGELIFTANVNYDRQLLKTSGDEATTYSIKSFGSYALQDTIDFVRAGDNVFFIGKDSDHGYELWVSDGSELGTRIVRDVVDGPSSSFPLFFNINFSTNTSIGSIVYYAGYQPDSGLELWRSDGTEKGTYLVKDIRPGSGLGIMWNQQQNSFAVMNDILFFAANNGPDSDYDLWKSDGTEAGTVEVKDLELRNKTNFLVLGNSVYFTAYGSNNEGYGLWRTDGTSEGTVMVHEMENYGPDPVAANNKVFFTAHDEAHGTELWCYDPSTESAHMVKDINPGPDTTYIADLTDVDGTLFFRANDYLWISDGTGEGTVQLTSAIIDPANLSSIAGTLYFSGYDAATGTEPYIAKIVIPAATPEGQNVTIHPVDMTTGVPSVTVDYREITAEGTTTVSSSPVDEGETPPAGFMFGDPAVYFEIETTASYDGVIHLCFNYSGYTFADEDNLVLLHSSDGLAWDDITVALDTENNIICGETDSFSKFAIVQDIDIDDDMLPDEDEINFYGTNPFVADTDGDGLLDGVEIEIAAGTGCPDPLDPDSDDDGLIDGHEVIAMATDPCSADSDGDGVEDLFDADPLDPGGTDPGTTEGILRSLGDMVAVLPLDLFIGPNLNSVEGRRASIATRLHNAAKALEDGDVDTARTILSDILDRVDNDPKPKDWMYESESQALVDESVRLLLSSLAY